MRFKYFVIGSLVLLVTVLGIIGGKALWSATMKEEGKFVAYQEKVGNEEHPQESLQSVKNPSQSKSALNNNPQKNEDSVSNKDKTPAPKKSSSNYSSINNSNNNSSKGSSTYYASPVAWSSTNPEKVVFGYYAEDWNGDTRSYNSLVNYNKYLNGMATFNFFLSSEGNISGVAPSKALQYAGQYKVPRFALIHNFSNGSFSSWGVHQVLASGTLRAKAVNNIVQLTTKYSYEGINIDLESVPPGDRSYYSQFIKSLADKLHAKGKLLTISAPAKTWDDPKNGWSGAFDYRYLGSVTDGIMIMTYDEHWFGGSPGPVASIGWVRQVASYAVKVIPRSKIYLGVAAYGYDWESGTGKTEALPYPKAISRAYTYGATIQWHNTYMVPYYTYWKNGRKHEVWFESPDSVGFKMNLVKEYGLKGAALWRMGFEDKSFWAMVARKF